MDRRVRLTALYTLARAGEGPAVEVPFLIEALDGPDREERRHAIRALQRMGPDAAPAVPSLGRLLESEDKRTRQSVVEALRRIGPGASGGVPALVALYPKADWADRPRIAEALGDIGEPRGEICVFLREAMRGRNWSQFWDRRAAWEAYVKLGCDAFATTDPGSSPPSGS